MIGSGTKYKNTTRTIAGAINFVFNTDVVLLCDTSLGIVDLTLLDIPQGNFSTQYKLYVVDKSNNASANNITIKAPTGFTVNNSATAVINVNGGVAVITISSNKTYNVAYNYTISGGGGNPLIIKNEGTQITPSATSIDFVGAPVTATAVGNDVTVTVTDNGGHPIAIENEGTTITPDVAKINFTGSIVNATAVGNDVTVDITLGFISVSYVALTTLISTNALVPSQQYLITDAIFVNGYPFDITDFKENVPIVVTAISTNEISLSGSGIFLNADYQKVGDYSAVTGFVAPPQGIWNLVNTYVIGNVVIWDGVHWVNITGTNSEPNLSNPDWTFLPKTSTNGYITEIDIVKYNVATNQITYREDVRNNRVENNIATYLDNENREAFWVWQWGNDKVTSNTILAQSYFCIKNQTGTVLSNLLDDYSIIYIGAETNSGIISYNIVIQNSFVDLTQNTTPPALLITPSLAFPLPTATALFSKNTIKGCGTIGVVNEGQFVGNNFELVSLNTNFSLTNLGSSSQITNNFFKYGTCANQVNNLVDGGIIDKNDFVFWNNQFCEGFINITNNGGQIIYNKIYQPDFLVIAFNSGTIRNNLSEQSAYIDITNNTGFIVNNTASQYGQLRIGTRNEGTISGNELFGGTLIVNINVSSISGNKVWGGILRVQNLNSSGILGNILSQSDLTLITDNLGQIRGNELSQESILTIDSVLATGKVNGNILKNKSTLKINGAGSGVGIQPCEGTVDNNFISNSTVELRGGVDVTGTLVGNNVETGSTIIIRQKMIGQIEKNRMYDGSLFVIENFADITADFYSNYLNSSNVTCDFISDEFKFNNFNDCNWSPITYTGKIFSYNTWTSVDFRPLDMSSDLLNTEINTATVTCPTFNINIDGGIVQDGINTISRKLDLSDPAIWDSVKGQITIPACSSTFFGYYELENCDTLVVRAILNSSKRFPTRFRVYDPATYCEFEVQSGVASAGTHEFVYDVTGGYPIPLRLLNDFGVQDYIVILRSYGDLNCIETYKHYV